MRIAKVVALVVGLAFVGSMLSACKGGGCNSCNSCNTCESKCNTCEPKCNTCEKKCNTCQPACGSPCGVPQGGYVQPAAK
jgi:hypothetical protein